MQRRTIQKPVTMALLGVIVLSAVCLGIIAVTLLQRVGDYGAGVNEVAIMRQADAMLSGLLSERAAKNSVLFFEAMANARLLAEKGGALLDDRQFYATGERQPGETFTLHTNGFMSTNADLPVYTTYCCLERVPGSLRRDVRVLSHLDPLLISMKQAHSDYVAVWVGRYDGLDGMRRKGGTVRYYPNTGYAPLLPPAKELQIWERDYITATLPENNPEREGKWTLLYADDAGQGAIATVTHPMYGADGVFYGVAGIDITLEALMGEILHNDAYEGSPAMRGGVQGHFPMLVSNDGSLLAVSQGRYASIGLTPPRVSAGLSQQVSLHASSHAGVREFANRVTQSAAGSMDLEIEGRPFTVYYQSLAQPEWSIALFVPRESLLASVHKTRAAITRSVATMARWFGVSTVFFAALAFCGALWLFRRRLITPLNRLTEAIDTLKAGGTAPTGRIGMPGDEINRVAVAFSDMAAAIHAKHLKLCEAEEGYRRIFENVASGIFRISDEGVLTTANPALARMLGYRSTEELLAADLEVEKSFVEQKDMEEMLTALSHNEEIRGREILLRRREGDVFWASISAMPERSATGAVQFIDGVVEDISRRKQADADIRALRARIARLQEEEQQRISLLLHDDVAQELTAANLGLQSLSSILEEQGVGAEGASKVNMARQVIKNTVAKVRDLSYAMHPPVLEEFGFVGGVAKLCEEYANLSGAEVDFLAVGMDDVHLDTHRMINMYRIVQEALSNAVRHAQAKQVAVRIARSHPSVIVRIVDDGMGFEPSQTSATPGYRSMGLANMRERAALLGGKLHIESRPGEGTRVVLDVMIDTAPAASR